MTDYIPSDEQVNDLAQSVIKTLSEELNIPIGRIRLQIMDSIGQRFDFEAPAPAAGSGLLHRDGRYPWGGIPSIPPVATVYCTKYKAKEPHVTHWETIIADGITFAGGQCPGINIYDEDDDELDNGKNYGRLYKAIHEVPTASVDGPPYTHQYGVAYIDAPKKRWWQRLFRRG